MVGWSGVIIRSSSNIFGNVSVEVPFLLFDSISLSSVFKIVEAECFQTLPVIKVRLLIEVILLGNVLEHSISYMRSDRFGDQSYEQ